MTKLNLAYQQLNKDHPDLFKGCPTELKDKKTSVKRTQAARDFDNITKVGICFEDDWDNRKVGTWDGTGDNFLQWMTPRSAMTSAELFRDSPLCVRFKLPHQLWLTFGDFDTTFRGDYHVEVTKQIDSKFQHSQSSSGQAFRNKDTGTGDPSLMEGTPFTGYQLDKTGLNKTTPYVDSQPELLQFKANEFQHLSYAWWYTPSVLPSSDEVTTHLPNGLRTQLSCFGVKKVTQPRKYELKTAALNKSLDAAFRPRDLRPNELVRNTLSLDTCPVDGEESHWVPVSQNPIDLMMWGEDYTDRQIKASEKLETIKQSIGEDKFNILVDSTNGMDSMELAIKYGKDARAIRQTLSRTRKALR